MKIKETREKPSNGGGFHGGQQFRVTEIADGSTLPADAVQVADETPTTDWEDNK